MTTIDTITAGQLDALRDSAGAAGDDALFACCDIACPLLYRFRPVPYSELEPDATPELAALHECVRVIAALKAEERS